MSQYERVCALLTDTVMLMCKNGVQFSDELKVQGLIGLTADKEVFIIQINEVIKAEDDNVKFQKPKKIVDSSRFTDFERKSSEKKTKQYETLKKSSPVSTSVASPNQTSNSQCEGPAADEHNPPTVNNFVGHTRAHTHTHNSYHISTNNYDCSNNIDESEGNVSNEQATDNFIDSNTHHDRTSPEGPDINTTEHQPLDLNMEQDSPIDLHVNSIPNWSSSYIESQVNGTSSSAEDVPDVKPSANDLEDWAANNMAPLPIPRVNHSAISLLKMKSEKRRYTDHVRKHQSTGAINLKTNNSFTSASPLQSIGQKQQQQQQISQNYASNNNSCGSGLDDFSSSKYTCTLCPAAYKHYCNLLTHEVKVHGRQKKKGGRRKKLEE